jgi:dTDP-4-dehydrorhamnose reductase|tara:strand:+ start:22966 stop:23856 length:891 start_codon:yes stop_codon:yes gene_type:complete
MKVLLIGASGQVGRCLSDILPSTGFEIKLSSRSDIDLLDLDRMEEKIMKFKPNIIINTAAYTNVDMAESDHDNANRINNTAVLRLAQICKSINSSLIHLSTDYVFNGQSNTPYSECDETDPLGIYGKTKRLGEIAIQDAMDRFIIIRTSWIFSEYGNNFLKTMLRLGEKNTNLKIVGDQKGQPTYAHDIANAVLKIINKINLGSKDWGIYHYSGNETTSWFNFAQSIFEERHLLKTSYKNPLLVKISSKEFKTKAERPMFSVLDNSKIFNTFNVNPSNWKTAIKEVLKKIDKDNGL